MARTASISVLLLCWVGASLAMIPRDFSSSMVDYINNLPGNTWKASYRHFGQPMYTGALDSDEKLPVMKYRADNVDLPDHFDAREQWPECPSIGMIRDQGSCGSCWAVAAAQAISDRICIASKGQQQVLISAEDIVSCCTLFADGCNGGNVKVPWHYYKGKGVVSGAFYGSEKGCRPYTIPTCNHGHRPSKLPQCSKILPTPSCEKKCREGYGVSYQEDKHFGGDVYTSKSEKDIMKDLMTNGPIEVRFDVYEDFRAYDKGIYQHVTGNKVSGHAIKLIGWGEENGTKYWLLANSWNENWGENGFFRMVRGRNECGIEENAVASIPLKSLKSSY